MPTSRRMRNLLLLVPLAFAGLVLLSSAGPIFVGDGVASAQSKKKRKLSKRQWKKMMNGWSRQIGKKCIYCHIKEGDEFDYEAPTPKKKIAAYCEQNFVDKLLTANKKSVTCGTCHDKKPTFLPREDAKDGK